jgi:hypothetical protein
MANLDKGNLKPGIDLPAIGAEPENDGIRPASVPFAGRPADVFQPWR